MMKRRMMKAEVNFVNLIDVTMVLLIIFMITAPTMQEWIELDLPSAKAAKSNISEGIIVSVRKDGNVFIDRDKMTAAEFQQKFDEIWKTRSGEPIYVRGDENVPYGRVVEIIGYVKKVGGENVGLVVEEDISRK
ncbi:MAG: biopolymer transporter ExbD [Candidatus Latescibacterota bacterium]